MKGGWARTGGIDSSVTSWLYAWEEEEEEEEEK